MMKVSQILLKQPWIAAPPIIALVMFFKSWGKIITIPAVQVLFLKIPVVNGIVRKSASAVSFLTLALLIEANVRLTKSLEITRDTSRHVHYKIFFDKVRNHILNGLTLPDAFLVESHWLGNKGRMICGMMEVAAETGAGTDLLNAIAEDYEDELDTVANQIDKLFDKLFEPFTDRHSRRHGWQPDLCDLRAGLQLGLRPAEKISGPEPINKGFSHSHLRETPSPASDFAKKYHKIWSFPFIVINMVYYFKFGRPFR